MRENDDPKSILDWLGYTSAPRWKNARAFGYVFGAIFLMLFLMSLSAAFVIVGSVILGALSNDVTAGGQLSAGALIVALLGAPFLIWRTMIAHQTLGFQKEGHITDRISKAVEQLGAIKNIKNSILLPKDNTTITTEETVANIEVRIGAILSLERIVQDSVIYDNGRDHVRIMEILCTYIRENTKTKPIDFNLDEWNESDVSSDNFDTFISSALGEITKYQKGKFFDLNIEARKKRFGLHPNSKSEVRKWLEETVFPEISEDIILALKVIGRRNLEQRFIERNWRAVNQNRSMTRMSKSIKTRTQSDQIFENGYRIDLRGVNLQKVNLPDLDFSGTIFDNARLEGSNFANCLFIGTSLHDTNFSGAYLYNVNFTSATGRSAKFESAYLCASKMNSARFFDCDFNGANFSNSYMDSADFERSKFICSYFLSVEIHNCKFIYSNLFFSYFSPVYADGTDFTYSNMKLADLTNANLVGSKIEQEILNDTKSSGNTRIPENLTKPTNWKYTNLSG